MYLHFQWLLERSETCQKNLAFWTSLKDSTPLNLHPGIYIHVIYPSIIEFCFSMI